jgi:serine phosphatase RsbU (regulator of sigma subunit)
MIFTTLPTAFGILHFILFIFFKRAKENLYFAFFLFFYGASIFFDYQHIMFGELEQTMNYVRIHRAMIPVYSIFALRFVYSLFYKKLPRQFRLFSVIFVISGILDVAFIKGEHGIFFYIAMILFIIEISRVIGTAIHKKRDGAWITAVGFSIFFFFSIFDTLMDLGVPTLFQQMENPYAIGTFGFVVTMSVYLARNYAGTHEQLLQQERQARGQEIRQRLLEEDNARKTRELEEARQLQLSMLPQCVHNIPGLDVCFQMETAAEVGGDYYDYHLADDGTLTIAVGDATGHGMKAGIMVSVIKTLFITNAAQTGILSFINQCNTSIKQMQMGNLYMALVLVRIKGNKLTVSSAGMPPVLIYRKADRRVEEIMLKGPPLGGFSDFSYRQKETELMPGDTVLSMSDGLPELFNENDEMMGYARVKRIFKDAALRTPDEIVSHLCAEGKRWRDRKVQDDDMTFVALKIKSKA